uniref:Methyltransf_21 domain-containing protein n=1 Tax=Steinernema glaseri TaxID=37863 RepID=A0A1I7ZDH9_9BILA
MARRQNWIQHDSSERFFYRDMGLATSATISIAHRHIYKEQKISTIGNGTSRPRPIFSEHIYYVQNIVHNDGRRPRPQVSNRVRTSHTTMDNVPALFIKSVLCLSSLSTVEPVKELASLPWSQLAADQMARRKNWTLFIYKYGKEYFGFFRNNHEAGHTSFQEFARTDPALNHITDIRFYEWDQYYGDFLKKGKATEIATDQDVESLKRRLFARINYGALDKLTLTVADDIGLHSAIVHHLVDKNAKISFLGLEYQDAGSTELLERLVQNKVISVVDMYGDWPPESTVPLVEALIPQQQLRTFECHVKMSISQSFFESLVADWKKDDTPRTKQIFFRNLETTLPLESGMHLHPNSKEQLFVEADSPNLTTLIFSYNVK